MASPLIFEAVVNGQVVAQGATAAQARDAAIAQGYSPNQITIQHKTGPRL